MKYCHKIQKVLACFVVMLAFNTSIIAEPISKSQALLLASKYVSNPILKKSTAVTRAIDNEKNPSFYLFDNAKGKGFVIISGESKMSSLVAYSEEGDMKNAVLPQPMVDLLKNYTQIVKEVREGKRKITAPKITKYAAVEPLTKTKWGQATPYNNYTPQERTKRTLTGCVATAMSQIMYFHKWPKKRYKNAPVDTQELSQIKDSYDWDLMKETYNNEKKGPSASAVATLMRDAGTAVNMLYSLNSSGAYIKDAAIAFRDSFQYDIKYFRNLGMSANTFREELIQELSKGYPVLGKGGAHAWVYDGYNEEGLVHVNWGWYGFYNGYFDLSVIGVGEVGEGGGNGKYWVDPEMILLRPRDGQHELFNDSQKRLTFYSEKTFSFNKNSSNNDKSVIVELYDIGTTKIKKGTSKSFVGHLGVAFYNQQNDLVKIISYPFNLILDNSTQRMTLRRWMWDLSDLKTGTYRVVPVSKALISGVDVFGEWQPFENAIEAQIRVENRGFTIISPTPNTIFTLQDSPSLIRNVYENGLQTGNLNLSIHNISNTEYRGHLRFTLAGTNRKRLYAPPMNSEVSVIQRNGTTQLTLHIPSSYNDEGLKDSISAGKYKMNVQFIYRDSQGNQHIQDVEGLQNFDIEVLPKPSQGLLSVRKMQLYINKQPTYLQEINRADQTEVALSMDLKMTDVGGISTCKGNLIYCAKDLETGEMLDLASINNLLLTSSTLNISDITKTVLNLSSLKEHQLYQLYAYLEQNNNRIDIGMDSNTPRYLKVYGIAPPTGIKTIENSKQKAFIIYNLQGIRQQSPWQSLPAGVYIVNGQKVYKY
jgi:peptidase C10 family protein